MSAVDLDMTIERQPEPTGDRVKIGMADKFPSYKYYDASGSVPVYGLREE